MIHWMQRNTQQPKKALFLSFFVCKKCSLTNLLQLFLIIFKNSTLQRAVVYLRWIQCIKMLEFKSKLSSNKFLNNFENPWAKMEQEHGGRSCVITCGVIMTLYSRVYRHVPQRQKIQCTICFEPTCWPTLQNSKPVMNLVRRVPGSCLRCWVVV